MDSSLSNAAKANEAVSSTRIDSAVDVNSETEMSKIGVSLDYAHDPSKHWYVMRISYNREQKAYDELMGLKEDILVFLPKKKHKLAGNEGYIITEQLLISNLLFIYSTKETIDRIIKNREKNYLHYYYKNHAKHLCVKGEPMIVPNDKMDLFIQIVLTGNEHIVAVDETTCRFKTNQIVRIKEGLFTGVIGRVARIAQQQRVVVQVEGVCCIGTSYIPSAFLEPLF